MQSSALLKESETAQRAPRSVSERGFTPRLTESQLHQQAVALAECFPHDLFPKVTADFVDDNIRTWREIGLPDGASDIRPVLRRGILGDDYEHDVRALVGVLKAHNLMSYSWGSEHYRFLRPEPRSVLMLHELERTQKGSIIFVPVDLTGRHTGVSALDARRRFADNEFGLGAFEGGCWLLSQRKSIPSWGLKLMYIGDTYNPGPGSDSKSVPAFKSEEHDQKLKGKIYFGRRHVEEVDKSHKWQVPTGFVPQ